MAAGKTKTVRLGFSFTPYARVRRDVPDSQAGAQLVTRQSSFGLCRHAERLSKIFGFGIAKFLNDCGLKCCGMHLDLKPWRKRTCSRRSKTTARSQRVSQCRCAKEKMASEDDRGTAGLLNERSAECRPHKMLVGYHAHPFDFEKIKVVCVDCSSAGPAGGEYADGRWQLPEWNGDPVAMLKEFPARTRTIHIKEHKDKTFESDYYKEVFQLCETSSGTKCTSSKWADERKRF